MIALRIFAVLVITVTASRQASGVSPKCREEVKSIQTKEKAAAVGACEEKAQYPQQAIGHLQKGDRVAAIATIEESFQKCAKFSETCSKELAPVVIQQLEFSGMAVSDTCKQSLAKVRNDKKKLKEVEMCEQKDKVMEKMLTALNKDDLKGAVGAAKSGLQKCMGLSDACAGQIAPVIVNQAVMAALREQQKQQGAPQEAPMTVVFTSAASAVLDSKTAGKVSLIRSALDQRVRTAFPKKKHATLLQKVRAPKQFVSRMIMQMAHSA